VWRPSVCKLHCGRFVLQLLALHRHEKLLINGWRIGFPPSSRGVLLDSSLSISQHHKAVLLGSSLSISQHHKAVLLDSSLSISQHNKAVLFDSSLSISQHHKAALLDARMLASSQTSMVAKPVDSTQSPWILLKNRALYTASLASASLASASTFAFFWHGAGNGKLGDPVG
jgi:hypothetical protein